MNREGKGYIYSDCETCNGQGWLDVSAAGERATVIGRCPRCDGQGEVLREIPLPLDWAPCTECEQRCGSQLEFMEENDGEPWPTCSVCGLPPDAEDDDDDEPTQRYQLPPAPMLRARAPELAGGQVIDVRWFIEARRAEDDAR